MSVRLMRIRFLALVGTLILAGCLAFSPWGVHRVTELEEVVLWQGNLEPICGESTDTCRPPWGMAVDGGGTVYITDSGACTLIVLGPGGDKKVLSFEEGVRPAFPALVEGRLFFFDEGSDLLRGLPIEDLHSAGDSDTVPVEDGLCLASTLGEILSAAGYGTGEDEDPMQATLHRLEGVGSDLFVFADLVTDRAIYRVAVAWPPMSGESDDARWIYLAMTGESPVGWREIMPEDRAVPAAAADVAPDGSLRSPGGDLLWQVETSGGSFLWRSHHPVMPHLVGGAQDGMWIAERRPAPAAGLGVTAFSSEWTLNWVTSRGELVETVRVAWPQDWRSGPTAAVHGGILHLLHPDGKGQAILRSVRIRTHLRWGAAQD